jgi:hypothetical protein
MRQKIATLKDKKTKDFIYGKIKKSFSAAVYTLFRAEKLEARAESRELRLLQKN